MIIPEELIDHLESEINIGNVDKKVQNLILIISEEIRELKKQLNDLEKQSAEAINKHVARGIELVNQQKEFIEYLEEMLDSDDDNFSVVRVRDVLSKYKEIIGGDNK